MEKTDLDFTPQLNHLAREIFPNNDAKVAACEEMLRNMYKKILGDKEWSNALDEVLLCKDDWLNTPIWLFRELSKRRKDTEKARIDVSDLSEVLVKEINYLDTSWLVDEILTSGFEVYSEGPNVDITL